MSMKIGEQRSAGVETFQGNYKQSLEMCLRGLELARRVDNPRAELNVQQWAAADRLLTGDLKGAKPHLNRYENT